MPGYLQQLCRNLSVEMGCGVSQMSCASCALLGKKTWADILGVKGVVLSPYYPTGRDCSTVQPSVPADTIVAAFCCGTSSGQIIPCKETEDIF